MTMRAFGWIGLCVLLGWTAGPPPAAEAKGGKKKTPDTMRLNPYWVRRVSLRSAPRVKLGKKRWKAIQAGLTWLAAHQSPSGAWEPEQYTQWCNGKRAAANARRPTGVGHPAYREALTGLALTAFLGVGYGEVGPHPFHDVVARGLKWLRSRQDADGCLSARNYGRHTQNHGFASWALADNLLVWGRGRKSTAGAMKYLALARNPYFAYRYGVKPGDNSTATSTFLVQPQLMVHWWNQLQTEPDHKVFVDEAAFDGVLAWIWKMTDPDYGEVGYISRGGGSARPDGLHERFPQDKTESMTAAGMWFRAASGEESAKSAMFKKGADLCMKALPRWDPSAGSIDLIYWYWGSLAMESGGGKYRDKWNEALEEALLDSQIQGDDPCYTAGSWDPLGPWAKDGGRLYSTAMSLLALQAPVRRVEAIERSADDERILRELLGDKSLEPWRREAGRQVLIEAVPWQPVSALKRLLSEKDDEIQKTVLATLIGRGPESKAAAARIRTTLKKDRNVEVRALAAQALGAIGESSKRTMETLTKALEDKDGAVRLQAAIAFQQLGGNATTARKVLEEAAKGPDEKLKQAALVALGRAKPPAPWRLTPGQKFGLRVELIARNEFARLEQERQLPLDNETRVLVFDGEAAKPPEGVGHRLVLSIRQFTYQIPDGEREMRIHAREDEKGDPVCDQDISERYTADKRHGVNVFFRTFAREMLGRTITVDLDADGRLVASSLEGDPLTPLESKGKPGLLKIARLALDAESLPSQVGLVVAATMPGDVKRGTTWAVEERVVARGVTLTGAGEARLASTAPREGRRVATVEQKVTFRAANLAPYRAYLIDMVRWWSRSKQPLSSWTVELEPIPFECVTKFAFDLDAGHPLSEVGNPSALIQVRGTIAGEGFGPGPVPIAGAIGVMGEATWTARE